MVTTGADHSMMDRSLMILENEHALLEDKQAACENLERYCIHLLQTSTEQTPLKGLNIKAVKILLQYVEQAGNHKLTIPALSALRAAVDLISRNVNFGIGMKLAALCYGTLVKSYRSCDTSFQAGILVEMFRCMAKFNDAQFFEAITSNKTPYAELKEVFDPFLNPSILEEMDLNRQAVRLEALRFLKRFLRIASGSILGQVEQEVCYWMDLLLQHMFILFKENNKVGYREMEVGIRQEAKEALELLILKITPAAKLRSEKWVQIKKDIRDVYADIMVKMVGTCPEWSEHWILVLQLLDKELITKGNNHLINRLLMVEERAFKYDRAEVRMVAFTCWCHLIDKFIPEYCENYKESVIRSVRLLMQPLQANNARTEAIALQKLYTWWHLMHRLESCAEVLVSTVLSPFLSFCFGSAKLKDQCPGKRFLSLHLPCAKSLLFILEDRPGGRKAEEIVLQSTNQKIAPFKKPLLNSVSLFLDVSEELTFCIGECITVLSNGNHEGSKELIQKIWQFLLTHIQKSLKSCSEQSVKVVQDLLRLLRQLTETKVLPDYYINILLEDVVKSSKALPTEVLAAPMYYVGNGPRFMAGTPALLLVECMMSDSLLPLIKTNTRYTTLLKHLIRFGIDHCNTLDFIQAVMKNMESVNCSLEQICLLWKIVASACIKYLKSGGQVNQGSDHQPDFTCFYTILMFPLQHICSIPHSEASEVVLVWHELYKLFCVAAKSTVANLEVVEIQETLACKMNQILIKNSPKAAKEAIAILKVTQDIVNSVPFSEVFGSQPQVKRRGRSSCGISNVLNLVMKLPRLLNTFERVEEFFNTSWALLAIMVAVMLKNMKQTNAMVTMPVAWQLSDAVSALLQVQVVHDGTSRFCSDSILRMWKDYLRFMETSLSKKSLKDALSWLCCLLEFGFKNTLLEVRITTIEFWDNCLYPACHKEGMFVSRELQDLREKCGSTVARHSIVVADSEDDNASDIQHGRANKENICNSDAVVKGKSKSLVQQLKDDGHVLTRHQKEILRSKKDDIPALYSSTLQPEQDSQYSQNSESSQDMLEFTGPSRILEAVSTHEHSLKVLEPPSAQRRLAEYRKKMMIDDEGSIILASVSTSKQPEPQPSCEASSNKAGQDELALNNRKLNLESVAVPMLSTEVTLSISSPPAQTSATESESFAVDSNVELDCQRNLEMSPNALQHLVSTNRDTLTEDGVMNGPVLLQDYAAVQFVNTDEVQGSDKSTSAEQNSLSSILNVKDSISSVNYFKAVSIALADDDEEEEEDDGVDMLNISVGSKRDATTSGAHACTNIQTSPGTQDDVKVVVEKVEDFSLNKMFAALETITSTFDSAELQQVCSPRKSAYNSKAKCVTKDPVELDLQKLFEVESHNSSDEQKSSPDRAQKLVQCNPQSRSGHGRSKKDANISTARCTSNISPSLITGSNQLGKLTDDISKHFIAVNSLNNDQNTKEEEIIVVEEINIEKPSIVSEVEVEATLTDNSLLNSLSDVPNTAPAELIKDDAPITDKIDMAASRSDRKVIKHTKAKKSLVSHDTDKEKPSPEKRKRKRNSNMIKENTEQKTKRPRRSKLPLKLISTDDLEVLFADEVKTNKETDKTLSSHPVFSAKNDTAIKDGHAFVHSDALTINSNEKYNSKESKTFEFGKTVLSNITKVFSALEAGEEHKSIMLPMELNTSNSEKNSSPQTDNKSSSNLMAKGADKSLKGEHIKAKHLKTNEKNKTVLKPKNKLSKKGVIATANKKNGKLLSPLRKLRSAAKGNIRRNISALLRIDETFKVSEGTPAETESESPKSQTMSGMENKDSASQVSLEQKSKSNKPSKNETEIGDKLTKEKEQEPPESQDMVESSQSSASPSIFPWSNLKTCSVVVKKLDTSLEPGSKVNLEENLVLIKTPDDLSPYKVCSQPESSEPAISTLDNDRLASSVEKAKKNLKNIDGFSDLELNSESSEVDKTIKTDTGMHKEKGEAFVSKKSDTTPAGKKFKSITSNGELSVTETCKIKKSSPAEDTPQTKSKKTYIQTLITEVIPNTHERKEQHEATSSSREGVKTRLQKVIPHPSAKEETQSKEKACSLLEDTNKAKTSASKLVTEEAKAKTLVSKSLTEESSKTKTPASKSLTEESSKTKTPASKLLTEETNNAKTPASNSVTEDKAKTPASKSFTEETCKVKTPASKSLTEETNKAKTRASKSLTEENSKAKTPASKSLTEESSKAKTPAAKSLAEETSKAKTPASKSLTEESIKAKTLTSKSLTEENSKAKTPAAKSLTEETSKAKTPASKSLTEESSKAKTLASKSLTEESSKAKTLASKSLTEETSKAKTPASKSLSEETSKAKTPASKLLTEETSKTKTHPSKLLTEDKAKSRASKSLTEEICKTKTQISKSPSKSHSEAAQTKLDGIKNIQKDHNCKGQGTNELALPAPKSPTKIHSPTKKVAVIQSCNTKSVSEAVDNSVHKETIKLQPASSEPFPPDAIMKSSTGEAAKVKKKLSAVEDGTSSSEKIKTRSKADASSIVNEEEAFNSKTPKAISVITYSEPAKEQGDNRNAVSGREFSHVQIEGTEVLKESEPEKTDLKSKLRKPKLCASASEILNCESFSSVEELVKSKTLLKNKLLNEWKASQRKEQPVVVSAKNKLEKSKEAATDTSVLNIETSEESSPTLPSDAADKEKSITTTSSQTKETSLQTAKLRKTSLRLSKIKSVSPNDPSDVSNSGSASILESEKSSKELDHGEKSSTPVTESDKVVEASTSNKEDTVKDKASQDLLSEEIGRLGDAESQDVTASPQVEKVSKSATGQQKRRGRPPNLSSKRLFPLCRKRSITNESPYKFSKNELETTPKSPKMRKLFNTDSHDHLIITPTHNLKNKAAQDTTEAPSPPATSCTEVSSVPVSATPEVQTSPSSLSSSPSTSSVSSVTLCPLPDNFSSETSPPKASSLKQLSPKSLLTSPSSLLKAFSSSPSTAEPKQSRIGPPLTLTGRAQFMVGLALVSKEAKSASESSAKHDSASATKSLFSSTPSESTAAVDSAVEKKLLELALTPMKRRSLLMDPKRRLTSKKKRVSFSETPQTILFECLANEKRTSKSESNCSEESAPHSAEDNEVMIVSSESEAGLHAVQEADSPDLSGLASQGSVQDVRTELLNSQQPIFPQLSNCNHPVEAVVAQLTNHPMWTKALLNEMYQRNIRTIGDLSKCDEVTINRLPIPVPKEAHTKKVLQDYQRTLSLLPRRGFWHSVGSRLVEQEGTSSSSAASPSPNIENLVQQQQRVNMSDCAKFIANHPKSLHAILEEAVKVPHAQEKLRKEVESIREELLGTGSEAEAQQRLEKMAEQMLSHREWFLNKIPVVELCRYLAMHSPEETEKWILEYLRTYLRADSFSFLEKLGSTDESIDLLNIIQSYIMVKKPIVDILEEMPKDSVLHFATSKITLADKMVMCAESLRTDNSPTSEAQLQKLLNAMVIKMKMSGALGLISQLVTEKLKSMEL